LQTPLTLKNRRDDFSCGGTPIGLIPDATFESGEVPFSVRSRLAIFSDGVTDAENTAEVTYDEQGVAASLGHLSPNASAEDIGRAMIVDLDRFRMGAPAKDDTTLLVVGLY
jgi:sigma-B regulation protein RsbU (phosphoserine phosphatase)